MKPTILANMIEGALWCPEHSACLTDADYYDGHAVAVTEFDVLCGTQQAEWLVNSCCHGCGQTFGDK